MPFNFPSFDHVPLENPPLREVICQIQFPPILKIGERAPVDFQEKVRQRFPTFGAEQTIIWDALGSIEGKPDTPKTAPTVYKFADPEGVTAISLSFNFCAFSTTKYSGWTSFADGLKFAISAVEEVYQPGSTTRVGLRYIDFLNAQTTGETDFDAIINMIRPELTAPFRINELTVTQGLSRLLSENADKRLSLIFGIVIEPAFHSFVLDFDLFTEKSTPFDIGSIMSLCDEFHATLYNAFRWGLADVSSIRIFTPKEVSR